MTPQPEQPEHCAHECVCDLYIGMNIKNEGCPMDNHPKNICDNDTRSRDSIQQSEKIKQPIIGCWYKDHNVCPRPHPHGGTFQVLPRSTLHNMEKQADHNVMIREAAITECRRIISDKVIYNKCSFNSETERARPR